MPAVVLAVPCAAMSIAIGLSGGEFQYVAGHFPLADSLPAYAIGCYDATVGRVLLAGTANDVPGGTRFRMWSWSGARWELLTTEGPTARVSTAIGCNDRTGDAVVVGGARRSPVNQQYETVSETWQRTLSAWTPSVARDISARDHHAIVYDSDRNALLLSGGIGVSRAAGAVWPDDTWVFAHEG